MRRLICPFWRALKWTIVQIGAPIWTVVHSGGAPIWTVVHSGGAPIWTVVHSGGSAVPLYTTALPLPPLYTTVHPTVHSGAPKWTIVQIGAPIWTIVHSGGAVAEPWCAAVVFCCALRDNSFFQRNC
jgi:hypothetical protein